MRLLWKDFEYFSKIDIIETFLLLKVSFDTFQNGGQGKWRRESS